MNPENRVQILKHFSPWEEKCFKKIAATSMTDMLAAEVDVDFPPREAALALLVYLRIDTDDLSKEVAEALVEASEFRFLEIREGTILALESYLSGVTPNA
jgi:hypothetical protein